MTLIDSILNQKNAINDNNDNNNIILLKEIIIIYDKTNILQNEFINNYYKTLCYNNNNNKKNNNKKMMNNNNNKKMKNNNITILLKNDCFINSHYIIRFINYHNHHNNRPNILNYGIKLSNGFWILPLDCYHSLHSLFFYELELTMFNILSSSSSTTLSSSSLITSMNNMIHPGRYNVLIPRLINENNDIIHLERPPYSSITSTIFGPKLNHIGLFLRSTWEYGIQYNNMMLFGWEDWDYWYQLDHQIGITSLIIEKSYIYYNITYEKEKSKFCYNNKKICLGMIKMNNPCDSTRSELMDSFIILQELLRNVEHISKWNLIQYEAANDDHLAKLLMENKSPIRFYEEYHKYFKCFNDNYEECNNMITKLSSLASIQEKNNNGLILFHIILTKLPINELWKQMTAHVVVGILDYHPTATLFIHTDYDIWKYFDMKFLKYYDKRIIVSPLYCHEYIAKKYQVDDIKNAIIRNGGGRPYQYNHFKDYYRYLLLYCFGGIYMDTDILLRQSVNHFHNVIPMESVHIANGGFLAFDRFNPVLKYCLNEIPRVHDPFKWGSLGPDVVTSAWNVFGNGTQINQQTKRIQLTILSQQSFFSIHWLKWQDYVNKKITIDEYNQRGNVEYGYHFWGMLFYKGFNAAESVEDSILGFALNRTCRSSIMKCIRLGKE